MSWTRRQACSALGALFFAAASTRFATGAAGTGGDADGRRALLDAVRRGDLPRVRRLLADDPSVAEAKDDAGRSAFVLAHVHGHEEVVAALREAGVALDVVEAVLAEEWEVVERLVREDPSRLSRAHPIGGTPLYAAALVGSLGFWRLRSLGGRPDAAPPGGSGYTPARGAMESARASWARIALADLAGNGADPNAPQRGGSSVLHGAVARRDATLVRLAVRKGADPAAVDDRGRTPRECAAELGWEEGELLLARPEALPRDDRSSRFALDANRDPIVRPDLSDVPREVQSEVTGASHFRMERVRERLAKDRRLTFSISSDDELAIEACAHTGNRPIMRLHLDHGAPLSLPTAVSLGDGDAVDFWLERRPSLVNERGAHDFPVMWYAVLGGGSVEMAERLLRHGVAVDQESVGTTALHWCARRGDRDLAAWLLEHGADPEPVGHRWNRAGETPLEVALAAGDAAMAALLRERGARR